MKTEFRKSSIFPSEINFVFLWNHKSEKKWNNFLQVLFIYLPKNRFISPTENKEKHRLALLKSFGCLCLWQNRRSFTKKNRCSWSWNTRESHPERSCNFVANIYLFNVAIFTWSHNLIASKCLKILQQLSQHIFCDHSFQKIFFKCA